MRLKLPNGYTYLVFVTPMHRRKSHSKCAYARVSDWVAEAGGVRGWGRTRRAAIANLKAAAAIVEVPK
jgi:hypothetical protein